MATPSKIFDIELPVVYRFLEIIHKNLIVFLLTFNLNGWCASKRADVAFQWKKNQIKMNKKVKQENNKGGPPSNHFPPELS
jgi:hypothetical protein